MAREDSSELLFANILAVSGQETPTRSALVFAITVAIPAAVVSSRAQPPPRYVEHVSPRSRAGICCDGEDLFNYDGVVVIALGRKVIYQDHCNFGVGVIVEGGVAPRGSAVSGRRALSVLGLKRGLTHELPGDSEAAFTGGGEGARDEEALKQNEDEEKWNGEGRPSSGPGRSRRRAILHRLLINHLLPMGGLSIIQFTLRLCIKCSRLISCR